MLSPAPCPLSWGSAGGQGAPRCPHPIARGRGEGGERGCRGVPSRRGSHPARGPLLLGGLILPRVPSCRGSHHIGVPFPISSSFHAQGMCRRLGGSRWGPALHSRFLLENFFWGGGVPALLSPPRSQHQHKVSVLPLSPPAQPPLITRGNKILINGWPLPGRGGLCAPPGAGGHSLSLLVSSASPLKGDQPPSNLGL